MTTPALSDYQAKSGHRRETHENCDRTNCWVCDLFICSICGALEGALLPTCPGRRLTEEEHDTNYKHYCDNTGPFAEEK